MKPLRIILAGLLETAARLWEWYAEEVQDKPHTLRPPAPNAFRDGKPVARCTCDATYRTAPCAKHPNTSALINGPRHDGGRSSGGNPFGH